MVLESNLGKNENSYWPETKYKGISVKNYNQGSFRLRFGQQWFM